MIAGTPADPPVGRAPRASFPREILTGLTKDKRSLRLILAAALVQSLFLLGGPWLSARAIDTALPDRATNMLAILALLAVAVAIHAAGAGWVERRLRIVLVNRLEARCLEDVLRRFVSGRFEQRRNETFGSTQQTLQAARQCVSTIAEMALGALTAVLNLLVVIVALLVVAWSGALMILGATTIAGAIALLYAQKEARLSLKVIEAEERKQQWLHGLLLSIPVLRVSGATRRGQRRMRTLLNESAEAELERLYAQVSRGAVSEGLPQLLMLGITAWLAIAVLNGTSTLGEMMMVTMLLGSFTRGAVGLINKVGAFQALGGSVSKVNRLLATPGGTSKTDIAEVAWLGEPHTGEGVVLKGVWYRYEAEQRWVLRDHHLCFPQGAISKLRAPSGSGKSTVLRLIAGLIAPERGEVQVHGYNPARYSGLVTYLPQQSHLLEASIATNLEVLCGKTPAELERTARLTGLHQVVEALPMGYETLVSSQGSNLSAGQCQLVLLTAAIAQERPVLLLDESTSQIDRRTREAIDWPALVGDRTVIVVDHD